MNAADVLAELEAYELIDRIAEQLHAGCAAIARQGGDLPYDAVLSRLARRVLALEGIDGAEMAVVQRPAVPTGITVTKALQVFERDDWTCRHCGARRQLTVDHVVARARGGADTLANLQTLCRSCNSRKGAR
jgi:hypothetical protein